jgi:hypothetical protein
MNDDGMWAQPSCPHGYTPGACTICDRVFNATLMRGWGLVEFHSATNEGPAFSELGSDEKELIEFGLCCGIHATFEELRHLGILPPLDP